MSEADLVLGHAEEASDDACKEVDVSSNIPSRREHLRIFSSEELILGHSDVSSSTIVGLRNF